MKQIFLSFLLIAPIAAELATMSAKADDVVPCEKMLSDLRAAVAAAKPSDTDKAKIDALENKGIERCNADDDAHADGFFAQAMKILGK